MGVSTRALAKPLKAYKMYPHPRCAEARLVDKYRIDKIRARTLADHWVAELVYCDYDEKSCATEDGYSEDRVPLLPAGYDLRDMHQHEC